ncbi:DUF4177 domain-containing protein [Myroides ceti]|uniref:DUF4177 domain-containing protein n=1 Tax=Paenimyroides ceti TaxID=395087 RepID=A0ABT8CZS8_9FLAO|nr:DUF4177 domain-containing protein [Paenimyroides ceti]MDN3708700.1 DUF4177 domain-containing protein [Paenimyroides ceti]
MKRFEYKVEKIEISLFKGLNTPELEKRMNILGMSGWELVSVASNDNLYQMILFLKREV